MAKYKITRKMMHKQLRFKGSVARKIIPYYKPSTFRFFNKFFKLFVIKTEKISDGIRIRNIYIDRTDGTIISQLRLCVFSPDDTTDSNVAPEKFPCMVWCHGGGLGQGVPEVELSYIKAFMSVYPCVAVIPDYRLSVKHTYPSAVNDCYDALLYVKKNARRLRIRTNQIFIGGDSAGGGLACAVAAMARDRKSVNIAFMMPLYPMLDDRMITDSSKDNDAPLWNTKSNECAWKMYLGDLYQFRDLSYYAAPGRLTDFSDLPPAATYVGSLDMFHDETVDFFKKLEAAGSEVRIKVFDGCFHGFEGLCKKSDPAKAAEAFIKEAYGYAVNNYFNEN